MLFFLCAAQVGMMVGWCNTVSALVRHADADVWVMAEQTPAYDYGTAIPSRRIYQVRSVPGVAWAEGLFLAWNTWQRPDGRRVNVVLIGLDGDNVGGPWRLHAGSLEDLHIADSVIVDELFLRDLGVEYVGDEAAMYDRRAVVRGVSSGVRTFTASPHVFASIRSARKYDRRYREDQITYVLARAEEGVTPEELRDRLRVAVPHVAVLTRQDFVILTMRYWMLETGVGITVALTAALALLVSTVVASQTLYALSQEHLSSYATLAALGLRPASLAGVVAAQALGLGSAGVAIGSVVLAIAAHASARTVVPLETTPAIYCGLAAVFLLGSLTGAVAAARTAARVDPTLVFRG